MFSNLVIRRALSGPNGHVADCSDSNCILETDLLEAFVALSRVNGHDADQMHERLDRMLNHGA